jgi:hypothetical protein
VAAVLCWLVATRPARAAEEASRVYFGLCGASAAVALEYGFFAVADDEQNVIRIYHSRAGAMPLQTLDLSRFLGVNDKHPEADIEGAARIGQKVFWITSHGENASGKERVGRRFLFATSILATNGTVSLAPFGQPYGRLLQDLAADPRLQRFKLATAATRAPKSAGALNIEGLAATADGRLLIGFRNPVPQGRGLVVPILNPDEAVAGGSVKLGEPVLLSLGGRGIRSIDRWRGQYLIVAGAFDGGGKSDFYLWSGGEDSPSLLRRPYHGQFNPEALAVFTDSGEAELLIVSDDSNLLIAGKPCKQLKDPMQKHFRAVVAPGASLLPRQGKAGSSESGK